jgi:peroxiredoxin Q/BCP
MKLKPGDRAPVFSLQDSTGNEVSLADFSGRKVLVYFYPKASTPGCTKQACSIRDNEGLLNGLGVTTIGISPDRPEPLLKFASKFSLNFHLLSDPDHKVAEAYGAWGEKRMYGKKYTGIIRSSFLIDEKGKIIDSVYGVKPLDTVTKVQAALTGTS